MKNLLDFSKWVSTKEINKGIEDILGSVDPNQKYPGDYIFNKLGSLIPLEMDPKDANDFFRTISFTTSAKIKEKGPKGPVFYSEDHLSGMRFKDSYWKPI